MKKEKNFNYQPPLLWTVNFNNPYQISKTNKEYKNGKEMENENGK